MGTKDGGDGPDGASREKVLFVCTHNSARSQMAEGFLKARYGDRYETFSAGTDPTSVNPLAVRIMREIGIDISHQGSKDVRDFLGIQFDYVVTVCDRAREACPIFPGDARRIHHGFADPSGFTGSEEEILEAFRRVRDEIGSWIERTFGAKKRTGGS